MRDLVALMRQSAAGLRALLVLTLLLGLAYPLLVGALALTMPWRANGSLVDSDGGRVTDPAVATGSLLLGQAVDDPGLFLPRPSVAGEGYDPLASGGSNLGPQNPDLVASIQARRAEVAAWEGVSPDEVPPDAVTASASGLDPHISPAYAALQVPRVAAAAGVSEARVRELVHAHTEGRGLGLLGEARVNVLALNLAVRSLDPR